MRTVTSDLHGARRRCFSHPYAHGFNEHIFILSNVHHIHAVCHDANLLTGDCRAEVQMCCWENVTRVVIGSYSSTVETHPCSRAILTYFSKYTASSEKQGSVVEWLLRGQHSLLVIQHFTHCIHLLRLDFNWCLKNSHSNKVSNTQATHLSDFYLSNYTSQCCSNQKYPLSHLPWNCYHFIFRVFFYDRNHSRSDQTNDHEKKKLAAPKM